MIGSVLRVRYELTQLLSEGVIFNLYAARDRVQNRDVAVRLLKQPFGSDASFVEALRTVVSKQGSIDHHGVETLVEVDEDEGTPFLVSELTPGVPLADRIRKLAPFSVPVAVSTAISLCEDLDALHSLGMAHGDINSHDVAALPDGQVRVQLPGMWEAYAASPAVAGTILHSMSPYLAPEISAGGMPSTASDVYAVGVLLHELLTGRLPYNADTPVAMAMKHATAAIPTVRLYNQSVPAVLDEIVKKALAKEPEDRYGDAASLLSDLRVLQDALRFGKTITWPITPELERHPEEMPKTAPARRPVREPAPKREREKPDVPMFLTLLIAVFLAVVLTMLGIWVAFNVNRPSLVKVPNVGGLTIDEARTLLKRSKLQLAVTSEQPHDKVPAGNIVSSEPTGGEKLRENGTVYVTLSTGSRWIVVPKLEGKTVDQVRAILKDLRLELDSNIVQRRSSRTAEGVVMEQEPDAGRKLEQGGKVKITVSSGSTGAGETTGATNLYTLRVKLRDLESPITLRVDIEDERGVRTIYEQRHEPEATVEIATRGTGESVIFRIYYDDVMVRELTQTAAEASGR